MDLSAQALPQSWYKGEGFTEIIDQVKQLWGGVVATAANLAKAFSNWAIEQLKKVNIFGVNIGNWFEEDPIGAAAAGAAVGLGTLVVVTTGAVGAVGRGLFGGVKWLVKGAKAGIQKIGAGKLIRWAVGGMQRIWNFNWNISDTQIRKQQQQMFEGLSGQLGEALGSLAGTAMCGFTLGRVALGSSTRQPQINPEMIAKLNELKLNDFSDESELWEESVENLKSFISAGQRTLVNAAVLEGFLNVRKLIKGASRGLNISAISPGLAAQIENWGAEGQKPWSFASAQEEFVESLPEGVIKNFTEEFLEGFQDQCAESTILVSYAM